MNKYTERIPLLDQIKIPMQLNTPLRRIRRWHYFWPISWLILIALGQIFVTVDVIGLEIASLILNMKYSFFFIGLMAAFFFIITWTSTFVNVCCCRRSRGCATCTLVLNILAIAASSVLLFYDALFLRKPETCLWPNNFCNNTQLNLNLFGLALDTSSDITEIKFTLIKIQMVCAAVMIVTCIAYVAIYIYTMIRMYRKNTVADFHTTIKLGRTKPPPPSFWPEAARDFPASTEF